MSSPIPYEYVTKRKETKNLSFKNSLEISTKATASETKKSILEQLLSEIDKLITDIVSTTTIYANIFTGTNTEPLTQFLSYQTLRIDAPSGQAGIKMQIIEKLRTMITNSLYGRVDKEPRLAEIGLNNIALTSELARSLFNDATTGKVITYVYLKQLFMQLSTLLSQIKAYTINVFYHRNLFYANMLMNTDLCQKCAQTCSPAYDVWVDPINKTARQKHLAQYSIFQSAMAIHYDTRSIDLYIPYSFEKPTSNIDANAANQNAEELSNDETNENSSENTSNTEEQTILDLIVIPNTIASENPTFDVKDKTGTNGVESHFMTIENPIYNVMDNYDVMGMFGIQPEAEISYEKTFSALYFIFEQWKRNLKCANIRYDVCHYNCHNNITERYEYNGLATDAINNITESGDGIQHVYLRYIIPEYVKCVQMNSRLKDECISKALNKIKLNKIAKYNYGANTAPENISAIGIEELMEDNTTITYSIDVEELSNKILVTTDESDPTKIIEEIETDELVFNLLSTDLPLNIPVLIYEDENEEDSKENLDPKYFLSCQYALCVYPVDNRYLSSTADNPNKDPDDDHYLSNDYFNIERAQKAFLLSLDIEEIATKVPYNNLREQFRIDYELPERYKDKPLTSFQPFYDYVISPYIKPTNSNLSIDKIEINSDTDVNRTANTADSQLRICMTSAVEEIKYDLTPDSEYSLCIPFGNVQIAPISAAVFVNFERSLVVTGNNFDSKIEYHGDAVLAGQLSSYVGKSVKLKIPNSEVFSYTSQDGSTGTFIFDSCLKDERETKYAYYISAKSSQDLHNSDQFTYGPDYTISVSLCLNYFANMDADWLSEDEKIECQNQSISNINDLTNTYYNQPIEWRKDLTNRYYNGGLYRNSTPFTITGYFKRGAKFENIVRTSLSANLNLSSGNSNLTAWNHTPTVAVLSILNRDDYTSLLMSLSSSEDMSWCKFRIDQGLSAADFVHSKKFKNGTDETKILQSQFHYKYETDYMFSYPDPTFECIKNAIVNSNICSDIAAMSDNSTEYTAVLDFGRKKNTAFNFTIETSNAEDHSSNDIDDIQDDEDSGDSNILDNKFLTGSYNVYTTSLCLYIHSGLTPWKAQEITLNAVDGDLSGTFNGDENLTSITIALVPGQHLRDLPEPDLPEGNYIFKGWYVLSTDGTSRYYLDETDVFKPNNTDIPEKGISTTTFYADYDSVGTAFEVQITPKNSKRTIGIAEAGIITASSPIVIDWGDGITETRYKSISSDTQLIHKYSSAGNFTVKINDSISSFAYSSLNSKWRNTDKANPKNTLLRVFSFGDSISCLPAGAFYDCQLMQLECALPSGLTEINDKTFYNCYGLTDLINLPNQNKTGTDEDGNEIYENPGISSIGEGAFYNCKNLPGITIPNTVRRLKKDIFYNNSLLKNIYCFVADNLQISCYTPKYNGDQITGYTEENPLRSAGKAKKNDGIHYFHILNGSINYNNTKQQLPITRRGEEMTTEVKTLRWYVDDRKYSIKGMIFDYTITFSIDNSIIQGELCDGYSLPTLPNQITAQSGDVLQTIIDGKETNPKTFKTKVIEYNFIDLTKQETTYIYTFDGWLYNDKKINDESSQITIFSNIELQAAWEIESEKTESSITIGDLNDLRETSDANSTEIENIKAQLAQLNSSSSESETT